MPHREDIDGRDHIGVVAVATLFTGEQGLLGTIRFRHMPTLRAGLRSVAWVDRDHFATAPRLFVLQHTAKRAPALIEDRLVQPGLLRDLSPWFFQGATVPSATCFSPARLPAR